MRASIPRLLVLMAVVASTALADEPHRFAFHNGDRIVLVGDTLIERDQRYGYLETWLTVLHPDKDLTFRNLGWSGDTVAGLSRAGFDPPEAGYRQLIEQVKAAKPTVLIVGYGMADSFDGEAGLSRFVEGLNRFLDTVAKPEMRVILLSPIAHAPKSGTLPDPSAHNAALEQYSRAIADVAKARGARFIDLFGPSRDREQRASITDDGIHLTERGYRDLAGWIVRALDPQAADEKSEAFLDLKGKGTIRPSAAKVQGTIEHEGSAIRFQLARRTIATLSVSDDRPPADAGLWLKVEGLATGRHELNIDGYPVATRSAEEWARGVMVPVPPDHEQFEKLRAAIHQKNRLFFHRWRPQNITYLFGFRKHEQGNNAVEIPQFDPLVAEQEKAIAHLRRPACHTYTLVPAGR